jgi:hypothetical protein
VAEKMPLTPDEEDLLKRLEAKRAEKKHENVLTLVVGGADSDTPLVTRLRGILKDAESGRFLEFVFVGLESSDRANIQWTGPAEFAMLGALAKALIALSLVDR